MFSFLIVFGRALLLFVKAICFSLVTSDVRIFICSCNSLYVVLSLPDVVSLAVVNVFLYFRLVSSFSVLLTSSSVSADLNFIQKGI